MKKTMLLLVISFVLKCESMGPVMGHHGRYHCAWEDNIEESYDTYTKALQAKEQYMTSEDERYRKCRVYKVEEEEVWEASGGKR